jgi:hypothetical protein
MLALPAFRKVIARIQGDSYRLKDKRSFSWFVIDRRAVTDDKCL